MDKMKKLKKINSLLIEHFGVPKRAKRLPNPVDLLIATILSQNTNDQNSYKAFKNLKDNYKNWKDVAKLTKSKLLKLIKIAGLGEQKSDAIKGFLNEQLSERGKINLNYLKKMTDDNVISELSAYKGIGLKTSACVLLFSMDRNVCPVDTHVHRTLNRIGVVKTKSPDKTFFEIQNFIPEKSAHSLHTNLIRLGREICKPLNPKCVICPLIKTCNYEDKNLMPVATKNSNKDFMLLDSV